MVGFIRYEIPMFHVISMTHKALDVQMEMQRTSLEERYEMEGSLGVVWLHVFLGDDGPSVTTPLE